MDRLKNHHESLSGKAAAIWFFSPRFVLEAREHSGCYSFESDRMWSTHFGFGSVNRKSKEPMSGNAYFPKDRNIFMNQNPSFL